jgi:hypothetical protein
LTAAPLRAAPKLTITMHAQSHFDLRTNISFAKVPDASLCDRMSVAY